VFLAVLIVRTALQAGGLRVLPRGASA
jgi:hypothetical protein